MIQALNSSSYFRKRRRVSRLAFRGYAGSIPRPATAHQRVQASHRLSRFERGIFALNADLPATLFGIALHERLPHLRSNLWIACPQPFLCPRDEVWTNDSN